MELDQRALVVDQMINGKVTTVPFAASTVHGSSAVLTSKLGQTPNIVTKWNPLLLPNIVIMWQRVWIWVWASYRDRKISDFLWRLLHQALPLTPIL